MYYKDVNSGILIILVTKNIQILSGQTVKLLVIPEQSVTQREKEYWSHQVNNNQKKEKTFKRRVLKLNPASKYKNTNKINMFTLI